eukprot:m.91619 g.91619  ORF g.91619 m.91619 type:complete len:287 (+) comp8877_c0_seq3:2218-3078(+)
MDWFLCNLCLAAFSQNGKFVITRCGHIFCGRCVSEKSLCPECNAPLATLLIHRQMKSGKEFFVQGNTAVASALSNLQSALKVEAYRNNQAKLALKKLYRKSQTLKEEFKNKIQVLQHRLSHPSQPSQYQHSTHHHQQQQHGSSTSTPKHDHVSSIIAQRHSRGPTPSSRLSIRQSPVSLRQLRSVETPVMRNTSQQRDQGYTFHSQAQSLQSSPAHLRKPMSTNQSSVPTPISSVVISPLAASIRSKLKQSSFAMMQINPDGTPIHKKPHSSTSASFATPAFLQQK